MKVGFIGLGNVGGRLAGSLVRNGIDTVVRDLDRTLAQPFLDQGAAWADSAREMAEICDVVITCLPSPAACSQVMEDPDGVLAGLATLETREGGGLRHLHVVPREHCHLFC